MSKDSSSNTARPRNVGPQDPNEMVEDTGQPKRRPEEAYRNEGPEAGRAMKQAGKPADGAYSTAKGPSDEAPPPIPNAGVGKQGSSSLPEE